MTIIIKGMKPPKYGCANCRLRTGKYCGQITENENVEKYVHDCTRHPDCPIIEVADHE